MNIDSKRIVAVALLLIASGQLQAKGDMQNGEAPKQRPSFESLDLNENGEIDFEEFSVHEIPHGDHETVFNTIDTDGSGTITEEEFANHKPPRPPRGKDRS